MPNLLKSTIALDGPEAATVIAALRFYQQAECLPSYIDYIASDNGQYAPLDDTEIDELCERINFG